MTVSTAMPAATPAAISIILIIGLFIVYSSTNNLTRPAPTPPNVPSAPLRRPATQPEGTHPLAAAYANPIPNPSIRPKMKYITAPFFRRPHYSLSSPAPQTT